MALTDILGNREELAARLDAQGVLGRWQLAEPALAGVVSLTELARIDRSDDVLGALVRLAAAAGSADDDALLVVIHLLERGAQRLARRLRTLHHDIEGMILGQLAVQIRSFPVARRTRAFAANLLLDTQAAVLRELCPYSARHQQRLAVVSVDPVELARVPAGVVDDEATELVDLLLWAERTMVVDADEVAVLLSMAAPDVPAGVSPRRHAAQLLGVSLSTVSRRHDRAVAALAAARNAYLAA
jgi:hypothetical protein